MRSKLITIALAVLAAGCAQDVADTGSSLRAVDEAAMTSQVLFVVPVSEVPLTEIELQRLGIETSAAIPVRVEIFDSLAVAWYAPEGRPLVGRDTIVALWRVVQREAIDGRLSQGGTPTVSEPSPSVIVDSATLVPVRTGGAEPPPDRLDVPEVQRVGSPVEQTIIDFYDRIGTPDEIWMMEELAGYHPGC